MDFVIPTDGDNGAVPEFGEDDGVFEFPVFQAFDTDERPPAPSEEDYPAGCEVDLVDTMKAKAAQTTQFWEPFMDDLFSGKKKRVKVIRHSGEYTFVEWNEDPNCIIGCSLYRACLKEPKVKFKRYNPYEPKNDNQQPNINIDTAEGGGDDDDIFAKAVTPGGIVPPIPQIPSTPPQNPAASPTPPPSAPSQPPPQSTGPGGFSTPVPGSSHQARRMRDRGNRAFQEGRFEDAVNCYTSSLEMGYSDTLRIYSNRSAAFLALRQTDKALEDARACIRADPRSVVGYVREANTMRSLKRYDQAKKLYTKALSIEPHNGDINYALLCNSAAEFFRVRTENLPVAVNLKQNTSTLEVVSRRKHAKDEVVFVETPHVTATLTPHLVDQGRFCGECHRPLIRKEEVAAHVSPGARHLVNTLFPECHHTVPCSEQCGQRYCSEACRNKAWTNQHWIECPVSGKWGPGVAQCRSLLASQGATLSVTIRARIMLTIRMIESMVSSGKSLSEAVSTFMWLPLPSPPEVHPPIVDEVLRAVFSTLQTGFGRDENALLDWALFHRTFDQTGSAVNIRCTPWPSFSGKVEAHLALLTQRNDQSSMAEALSEMLEAGKNIPFLSVDSIAIMNIFALCAHHPTTIQKVDPPVLNVELKPEAESTTSIQVTAAKSLRRGETLDADPGVFVSRQQQ